MATFIEVLCNVGIKDIAVVLCHFQRGVTQQLLECKGVSAAVHQILPGKGMAEQVRSRLRHPSDLVVTGDSLTQGAFCKLFAALIMELVAIPDSRMATTISFILCRESFSRGVEMSK